jgi:hypothetical protein
MKAICIAYRPYQNGFYPGNMYNIVDIQNYTYFDVLENKTATAKMYEMEDKNGVIHNFTGGIFNSYFITLAELRKQKLKKINGYKCQK